MSHARILSLAALALAVAAPARAATIKVKKGGTHPTIASGIAAASAGDTVKIEAGVYQENVVVGSALTGLQIVAHGKVIVEALPPGGAPSGPGLDVKADSVTVKGLTIRNAAFLNSGAQGFGIGVNANAFTAIGVTTLHCAQAGIDVDGDAATIDGCSDQGSGTGVHLANGLNCAVKNGRALLTNGPAISIDGCTNARVEDCRFRFLEGVAVSANDSANGSVQIRRCNCEGIDSAAFVVDGADAIVEDNVIIDCANGMIIRGDGFIVRRNRIRRLFDFTAIIVDDSMSGAVEDNEITEFRGPGIDIRPGVTGTTVNRNVLRGELDPGSAAIVIGGANIQLDGNQIADCAGDGISVTGNSNLLLNTSIEDCVRDGIDVESGAIANTVGSNSVRRCRAEGLDHSGSASFINDNTFENCRIDVANDGSILSFAGNTFSTGGQNTDPEID